MGKALAFPSIQLYTSLEMEFCPELNLAGSQVCRVIDRRCRSEGRIIRQHAGREVDARNISSIYASYIRTIKDIESLREKFKIHVLGEPDPFRDAQVCRHVVRTTIDVTQQRNADHTAGAE